MFVSGSQCGDWFFVFLKLWSLLVILLAVNVRLWVSVWMSQRSVHTVIVKWGGA